MNNVKGTALITGAGRGIGLELCKWFGEQGIHTIGISRNVSALKNMINVNAIEADLTDLENVFDKLKPYLDDANPNRFYVVHNAAMLINAPFDSLSEVQIRQMTEINYITPLRLTQHLIPWLKNINESHIIHVSSMGGFQGSLRFPGLSVYSSNKSAISSLSESLAEEYKDTSMRFNTLALGAVDTEMLKESLPGYTAKVSAKQIAAYIGHFAIRGYSLVNGKVIPLAGINPSF
jgi:NAD(P)-dependent dehydrogenase (short-subunit alcohol dehydrogenase family)